MKRVMIIGCPGSGKSTLSFKLNEIIGLPLYHLDMLYWNPDKTTVEKSVFRERLAQVIEREEWIIDGNYSSTLEMRLSLCDTVIYLDFPADVCLEGVRSRRGKVRRDMPWIETEEDAEFMDFIKSFNTERRPNLLTLLDKYKDKNIIILKSRSEVDEYIKNVTEKYKG